jgi:hypothetical protein
VQVFGVLDAACNPRLLRNDELETLARAIHARYVDACLDRGQRLGETRSLRPWSAPTRRPRTSSSGAS